MNPCFGIPQLRDFTPIFHLKAAELRDIWMNEIGDGSEEATVDALVWLSRTTLDVIGLAGFNYAFKALSEGDANELAQAFQELLAPQKNFPLLDFLQDCFPILRPIPTERGRIEERCHSIMRKIGMQLIHQKKMAQQSEKGGATNAESSDAVGRDILSVLVESNISKDVKDPERMTDDEILGQITTFILGGLETTGTTTMWLLYELAKPENHAMQNRLREELLSLSSREPSMDELNSLPYLDAVVRENVRINSVVAATIREADKDDVIPLSTPIVDRKGIKRNEIHVAKGQSIVLSVIAMNRDKSIWGEDAFEFNPERWLNPEGHPRSVEIPGVFSGTMTFLGGPRHCIGYRYALLEMKVLLFTLLRSFYFGLPDPAPIIEKRPGLVLRPIIKQADGTEKSYMPLVVRAVGSN